MSNLWYALPILVAVSLVYAATRHEEVPVIMRYAWHTFQWLFGFMAVLFAVIAVIGFVL